jgi:hypothetical protein
MSSSIRTAAIVSFGVALTGVSGVLSSAPLVHAQTSGTTGTTGSAGSVHASGSGAAPSAASRSAYAQQQPPSAAEKTESAETIVGRGNSLSQRVTQMLSEARREADMIRVTCLNDKLTQINANVHTAQSRLTAYNKAVDVDQRSHELTVLNVLGQKLQVLDQESNQCVGQDLFETGPAKIQVEINTALLPFETEPGSPPPTLPPSLPDIPPDASPKGM